jgi:hypothetical protein
VTATLSAPVAPVAPTPLVVPTLALAEARRLLRHPVTLVGFALWLLGCVQFLLAPIDPVPAFESTTIALSFTPGIPMIVAAHMVTTRDRRAGTLDLLGSAPARAVERVQALCLAAFAPALAALALNVLLFGVVTWLDGYADAPSPAQLAIPAATVLGGALLGVMVGVWSPALVSPVLAVVAMVAGHLALAEREVLWLLAPAVSWADWGIYDGSIWVGQHTGSPAWHLVYVLGLSGMAAAAAVVRVAERRAPVVVAGLVALAVTVAAAWLQLP